MQSSKPGLWSLAELGEHLAFPPLTGNPGQGRPLHSLAWLVKTKNGNPQITRGGAGGEREIGEKEGRDPLSGDYSVQEELY